MALRAFHDFPSTANHNPDSAKLTIGGESSFNGRIETIDTIYPQSITLHITLTPVPIDTPSYARLCSDGDWLEPTALYARDQTPGLTPVSALLCTYAGSGFLRRHDGEPPYSFQGRKAGAFTLGFPFDHARLSRGSTFDDEDPESPLSREAHAQDEPLLYRKPFEFETSSTVEEQLFRLEGSDSRPSILREPPRILNKILMRPYGGLWESASPLESIQYFYILQEGPRRRTEINIFPHEMSSSLDRERLYPHPDSLMADRPYPEEWGESLRTCIARGRLVCQLSLSPPRTLQSPLSSPRSDDHASEQDAHNKSQKTLSLMYRSYTTKMIAHKDDRFSDSEYFTEGEEGGLSFHQRHPAKFAVTFLRQRPQDRT